MGSRRSTLVAAACACLALATHAPAASGAVQAGNTGWLWGNPSPQVNSLARLDVAGGRLFAGGDSGTLMMSDDHGDSWQAISTGLLEPIRRVEAIRDTSVVFATRCGLRRTDDGGQTVRTLPWGPSQATCASPIADVEYPSLSTGYLVLTDGTLLTTEDGGQAWHALPALPGSVAAGGVARPTDLAFASRLTGVALVGDAILRTTDGGVSWSTVASVVGPLAVDFADASTAVAVGAGGAAWRTQDAGASFTPLPVGPGATQLNFDALHCASASRCVAIDGVGGTVAIVEPSGARAIGRPPLQALGDAIASNGSVLAVGGAGEVFRSGDEGLSWVRVSTRLEAEYRGLRTVSKRTAFAFGKRGAIAATLDGGTTWSEASLATRASVLDLSLNGARDGVVATGDGVVHRLVRGQPTQTTRVGKPAQAVRELRGSAALLVGPAGVRRLDARGRIAYLRGVSRRARLSELDEAGTALVAYGGRAAFVGATSGRGWSKLMLPATRSVRSLDFISARIGYLLDRFGELWFTETGGRAWRRIDATGDTAFTSVSFADRENGYLASASGRILRTWDGGSTWTRQFPFFDSGQDSPMLVRATGRDTAIALGTGTNRLLATFTGGQAGSDMRMTIAEGDPLFRRRGSVQVAGRVLPAKGGEVVTVLARAKGAKAGSKWVAQTAVADANGRFATLWKISKPTVFVARWSGDAAREGVAAVPAIVKPGRKR